MGIDMINFKTVLNELYMDVYQDDPYALMGRIKAENAEFSVKDGRAIIGTSDNAMVMNLPVDMIDNLNVIRVDDGIRRMTFNVGAVSYRIVLLCIKCGDAETMLDSWYNTYIDSRK